MTEHEWLTSDDPGAMLRLRRTDCCGCWWIDNGDVTVSLTGGAKPCGQCDNGPIMPLSPFSDRKLRLWCAACQSAMAKTLDPSRVVWSWQEWAENEQHNPKMTTEEAVRLWTAPDPNCPDHVKAALLREIAGNVFRPVTLPESITGEPTVRELATAAYHERGRVCGRCKGAKTLSVVDEEKHQQNEATGQYVMVPPRTRIPCPDCHRTGVIGDGYLDPARLAVLSDALEECGCTSAELLAHLRRVVPCGWCDRTGSVLSGGHSFVPDPMISSTAGGFQPDRTACPECKGRLTVPSPAPPVRGMWSLDLILGKS